MSKGNNCGFTLIELIIVIVILGILAAYAVPKYMNLDKKARISTLKGLNGTLRSAAYLVHAIAITKDTTGAGNVNIGSSEVTVGNGLYPVANNDGIVASITNISGFEVNSSANDGSGITSFKKKGAPDINTCVVNYDATNINAPAFNIDINGC